MLCEKCLTQTVCFNSKIKWFYMFWGFSIQETKAMNFIHSALFTTTFAEKQTITAAIAAANACYPYFILLLFSLRMTLMVTITVCCAQRDQLGVLEMLGFIKSVHIDTLIGSGPN